MELNELRVKILHRAKRVLRRLKVSNNDCGISNHDVYIALYHYSVEGRLDNPADEDRLHQKLSELTPTEMYVIRQMFWEGKTLREISEPIDKSHEWVRKVLDSAITRLRIALRQA